jgi:uncharacterized protein (UPF0261 family)
MESAGSIGIPQIVSTCGVNHITPRKSRYTREHDLRRRYDLDSFRRWLRMSPKELKEVAGLFAQKLNRSKGPVKILIPLRGWSSVDSPGNPTYDPAEDRFFAAELRKTLRKGTSRSWKWTATWRTPSLQRQVIKAALEIF